MPPPLWDFYSGRGRARGDREKTHGNSLYLSLTPPGTSPAGPLQLFDSSRNRGSERLRNQGKRMLEVGETPGSTAGLD